VQRFHMINSVEPTRPAAANRVYDRCQALAGRLISRPLGRPTFPSGGHTTNMGDLIIDTPRLALRTMRETDLDALLMIFADPKVMAAFNTAPFDREQMGYWLRRNLAHQSEHGFGLFSVILKSDGILIGDCGLERMQVDGRPSTELGYDFRSDCWNQGFATEAASAVRDFAFDTLRLPGLVSLIRVGNAASKRVSEKIGMRLDREIDRDGIPYWIYAMERVGRPNNSMEPTRLRAEIRHLPRPPRCRTVRPPAPATAGGSSRGR
jgi:[ribosomal protein S5]-alanine N-acetyltransferase